MRHSRALHNSFCLDCINWKFTHAMLLEGEASLSSYTNNVHGTIDEGLEAKRTVLNSPPFALHSLSKCPQSRGARHSGSYTTDISEAPILYFNDCVINHTSEIARIVRESISFDFRNKTKKRQYNRSSKCFMNKTSHLTLYYSLIKLSVKVFYS